VVITFDDGYADNLHNARPLLEKYEVPATVFVTTGGIEQDREFWWDELDRLLLQPGTLPDSLELKLNGSYHQWELGKAAQYSEIDCQHCRHWNALQDNFPTPRHFLYYSLYQLLYPLPTDKRQEVLDELRKWAKSEPGGRPTHRSLTNKELLTLDKGELIEIGAHTVTHPFLSKVPEALQRDEIQQSKDYLEKILGHTVMSFSYPNGDYTEDTISIVQEAGFTCACSSVVGRVCSDSNHFLLPRVVVEDWDGETFARWLSQLSFL
jgi:peptidoglycan/xylan/chitin deacetylase (PgdA/CDA1 family)